MEKGIYLFFDYQDHFEMLTDAELGQLMRALLAYGQGYDVGDLSDMARMAFSFIKQNIDRKKEMDAQRVDSSRENGKKGGRPRGASAVDSSCNVAEPKNPVGFLGYFEKPRKGRQDMTGHDKTKDTPPIVPQRADECERVGLADYEQVAVKQNVKADECERVGLANYEQVAVKQNVKAGGVKLCDITSKFEKFWQAYPRKVGKDAAFKAFQKKVTAADTLANILNALQWQCESDDWQKDDGRFIPHPTTYLNQGRWHDEYTTQNDDVGSTVGVNMAQFLAECEVKREEIRKQKEAFLAHKSAR